MVIEVGGVGFLVTVTESHARGLRVGDEARIDTVLVVREDGFTLFGFADTGQRALFDVLTGVSGVGPKLAMAVLSALTPGQISRAVADEDDVPFRSVSGIGPKMAKLIVVSLANRLPKFIHADEVDAEQASADPAVQEEVVMALTGLGWHQEAAEKAVADVAAPGKSVALMLREALVSLGGDGRG